MNQYIYEKEEVFKTWNVVGEIKKTSPFRRIYGNPTTFHRCIEFEGKLYCGDFACSGECGLAKIIRLRPVTTEWGGKGKEKYKEPVIIEQASALCGIENVWSNSRWIQSKWKGDIIICEYDGSEPYWM